MSFKLLSKSSVILHEKGQRLFQFRIMIRLSLYKEGYALSYLRWYPVNLRPPGPLFSPSPVEIRGVFLLKIYRGPGVVKGHTQLLD